MQALSQQCNKHCCSTPRAWCSLAYSCASVCVCTRIYHFFYMCARIHLFLRVCMSRNTHQCACTYLHACTQPAPCDTCRSRCGIHTHIHIPCLHMSASVWCKHPQACTQAPPCPCTPGCMCQCLKLCNSMHMYVHAWLCRHACVPTCMSTQMYARMCSHLQLSMCMHPCTRVQISTRMCALPHARAPPPRAHDYARALSTFPARGPFKTRAARPRARNAGQRRLRPLSSPPPARTAVAP